MALALSAKDKIIADLTARIEKLELDKAQVEADAAVREEVLKEELEVARAEAATMRTKAETAAKSIDSPAELALQQMRQQLSKIAKDNNGSEAADDDEATVQHKLSDVVKEFRTLEQLMRGYEGENAKLSTALKKQRQDATQDQENLRCENARLQQQVCACAWMIENKKK
mgnify:CR=1 FL=1